ncbi:uncharacterized protein LOC111084163 [Limulus polyphemus]|uniref:Uncharacterized protein LOC111084163 n=1 Tax=Limulus polyphemus TaxID=6850 RepID=A0ABM1RZ52_LIMPO|nr:uncharacterized protein LOC111084163 [Limulus polyphemus]
METDRNTKLNIPIMPVPVVYSDMSNSDSYSPSNEASLCDEVFMSEMVEELRPEEEVSERYYDIINSMSEEFQSVIKDILENQSSPPSTSSSSFLSTNVKCSEPLEPNPRFDISKRQTRRAEPSRSRPHVPKLRQRSASHRHTLLTKASERAHYQKWTARQTDPSKKLIFWREDRNIRSERKKR